MSTSSTDHERPQQQQQHQLGQQQQPRRQRQSQRQRQQQIQIYYDVEKWCQYHIRNGTRRLFFEGQETLTKALNEKCQEIRKQCRQIGVPNDDGDDDLNNNNNDNNDSDGKTTLYYYHDFQSVDSLRSFFRNLHMKHVKSSAYHIRTNITQYIQRYKSGQETILDMSIKSNIPPYLLCRQLVEHICDLRKQQQPPQSQSQQIPDQQPSEQPQDGLGSKLQTELGPDEDATTNSTTAATTSTGSNMSLKKRLTMAMRDPLNVLNDRSIIRPEFLSTEILPPPTPPPKADNITDNNDKNDDNNDNVNLVDSTTTAPSTPTTATTTTTRIAREVMEALHADALCGPIHDRAKYMVGIEYEVLLEYQLRHTFQIPFESESHLRDIGTSKTPDCVLLVPVAFQVGKDDWKIVNWIDSKAMYGDVESHRTSVYPQAKSYIHRYGPGMILYWFGHAPMELLLSSSDDDYNNKNTNRGNNSSSNDNSSNNDELFICSCELPKTFMWPTGEIETVS